MQLSIPTKWGKVWAGGRCARDLICSPCIEPPDDGPRLPSSLRGPSYVGGEGGEPCDGTLEFSDEDTDGYDETVTLTCQTEYDDLCEIHVFFAGHDGDAAWEIRPPKKASLISGVLTMVFWAWQLIDPHLWEALPPQDQAKLGLDLNEAIYVTSVDVYRVYNDETAIMSEFNWEAPATLLPFEACSFCGGVGCPNCLLTTQTGCLHVRDSDVGIVVPSPAEYTRNGWENRNYTHDRRADFVKIWYYAGDRPIIQRCDILCEPLSNYWAQTIAWLATARLSRPLC